MKLLLLFIIPFLLTLTEQNTSLAQQSSVFLKNVKGQYKNLNELKPVLVNESGQSIYLLPDDCGEAQLWLYYMNRTWMQGLPLNCAEYNTSLEIMPGETYQIPPLVWRPLRTWEGKVIERKNFPGKYKMIMRYSLEPMGWTGKPRLKPMNYVKTVTEEFTIVR